MRLHGLAQLVLLAPTALVGAFTARTQHVFPRNGIAQRPSAAAGWREPALQASAFPADIAADDQVYNAADSIAQSGVNFADGNTVTVAALLGTAVGLAAFNAIVYWRMQYITAALLTRRVPRVAGGADVLQLSAKDSKALYYLPSGGVRRVILSIITDLKQDLADAAAVQARVPVVSVRKQLDDTLDCPTGIMDAVISLGGFNGSTNTKRLIKEVTRVLKPGGQLIFVEQGGSNDSLIQELQKSVGETEVNIVSNLFRPYTVAVSTKTTRQVPPQEGGDGNRAGRRQSKANKKGKKGAQPQPQSVEEQVESVEPSS
eukprot:TRINITY_DN3262_c0_g1_i2.p1 TRINITY_DN3262_c0_g1~~TRINITY_DN3262_c0_g1_i2.p1  ORF type:complete len:343 (+),score=83.63 TRINITY_DN3262_c0_g1_i2:82-1029(+)